jgi:hypothetical protein
MGSLIKLAVSALLATGGVTHLQASITRLVIMAACLPRVMMLSALGCLAAALWILALPSLGPAGAPLVVAAAFLVVTLILVAVACRVRRPGRRKAAAPAGSASLAPELARILRDHKGTVLLAAALAGMAAASGRRK